MNDLIQIKQLPIIEEQLKAVSQEIETKVSEALGLICNEDTVKAIKDIRASLNKEAKEWEEKRKQVKEEIMKPYNDFEKVYKENIIDKYKKADTELKTKVDTVEQELKDKKTETLKVYFNEYSKEAGVDFIKFENVGLNITLSASVKSLKEQIKGFIDKVVLDLLLINTQEHKAEILVEYKKILDVNNAIMTVKQRLKEIEEEKSKEEVLDVSKEKTVIFEPNKVSIVKDVTVKFKLTVEQANKLKEFLKLSNIEYESEEL